MNFHIFCSITSIFIIVLLGNNCLKVSLASSEVPRYPRLLPNLVEVLQVVPVGKKAELSCPVEAADTKNLYVEWFRGDQQIDDTYSSDRLKVTKDKTLRISPVRLEDSGKYMCRAINGFGHVETNVSLEVISGSEEYPSWTPSSLSFLSMSNSHVMMHHLNINSSLRLNCMATGYPKPNIKWLKDGSELIHSDSDMEAIDKPYHHRQTRSKMGTSRWILFLRKVKPKDSGNYTCIVFNKHGTIKATFIVRVTAPNVVKLSFESDYPRNTTVALGEPAVLQCRVRSPVPPKIWWLKHSNWSRKIGDGTCFPGSIDVAGMCYSVLSPSTSSVEQRSGVYTTKLQITSADKDDAGIYVCMAVTSKGYIHREAYLYVLTPPSAGAFSKDKMYFWMLLSIPVFTLFSVIGAVLLMLFWSKRSSPIGYEIPVEQTEKSSDTDWDVNRSRITTPCTDRLVSNSLGSLTDCLSSITTRSHHIHHHKHIHHYREFGENLTV